MHAARIFRSAMPLHVGMLSLFVGVDFVGAVNAEPSLAAWVMVATDACYLVARIFLHAMADTHRAQRLGSAAWACSILTFAAFFVADELVSPRPDTFVWGMVPDQPSNVLLLVIYTFCAGLVNGTHGLSLRAEVAVLLVVETTLLTNALSAMPDGGNLWVTAQRTDDGCLLIIRDTGQGIPAERLDLIFEPFYTTKGDGTGLGLSITHTIISIHGGRIEVQSKEGEGSEFRVYLPGDGEN